MAARSGRITRNLRTSRNFSRRMATRCCFRIRAVQPATAKNTAQAIFADWGNKDFQDDMAMVDYAIAQGIADPDKLGVGGWSYGGISTRLHHRPDHTLQGRNFRRRGAEFLPASTATIIIRSDYVTELGHPWEHQDVWTKSLRSIA